MTQRIPPTLSTLLLATALSAGAPAAFAACLPGGNSATILQALNQTGTAELCQGATFIADQPIKIRTNGWRIFTTGLPSSQALKATIEVPLGATYNEPVIQAYTPRNVEIRNIVINGKWPQNPHRRFRSLVAISGANSTLDRTHLLSSSGLSFVDVASNPNCSGVRITNNYINGSGSHTTQSQWTDGIDIRCSNARIAHNTVLNATDGGITFFGGRDTVIENNWVANNSASAFSGIIASNAFGPNADFTGSVIRNNLVQTCCGQHLHVALAVGAHAWCDDVGQNPDCHFGHGVSFLNNSGSGQFGFGILVDGINNATVQGNNLTMAPWPNQSCSVPGQDFYVVNPDHSSGSFQPGYSQRQLHWPCIGPIGQ